MGATDNHFLSVKMSSEPTIANRGRHNWSLGDKIRLLGYKSENKKLNAIELGQAPANQLRFLSLWLDQSSKQFLYQCLKWLGVARYHKNRINQKRFIRSTP
jgi:hypothetical protein